MKKRKPGVKQMFSLKRRLGGDDGGTDDPIVRDWRRINQSPKVVASTSITERLLLLAMLPYNGKVVSDEVMEKVVRVRTMELRRHLEEVGELDSADAEEDAELDSLRPLVEELRAGLLHQDAMPLPNMATLGPKVSALHRRAWGIVCREFAEEVDSRTMHVASLLFLGIVGPAEKSISREERGTYTDSIHSAFCTWLYENREELLTSVETDELQAMRLMFGDIEDEDWDDDDGDDSPLPA